MTSRPAEVGGIAGAVALLIAKLLGVDDVGTVTAIGIVIGFIPAAITFVVELVKGKNGTSSSS